MKSVNKRVIYFDILNILACLCVIYMHCNGIVHSYANTIEWKQSMIVESVCYWAVPVFFMLSGATLLDYRERYSTRVFLKKRIVRVGIPFIIWTLINLVWKSWSGKIVVEKSFVSILSMIFNTQIENVYWFFIPLFAVYFCMPVLSKIKEDKTLLKYMIVCGLISYSILPVFCAIFGIQYNGSMSFPLTGGYVLYVLLGYVLATEKISKKSRYSIYLVGVACVLLRYFSTVFLSNEHGLYKVFWGYVNFPAVVLAISVFVFFKYVNWSKIFRNEKSLNLLTHISSASFGIYLIHMIVMNFFWSLNVNTYGLKWRLLGAPLIYVICLIIVKVMQHIPIVKKIVP